MAGDINFDFSQNGVGDIFLVTDRDLIIQRVRKKLLTRKNELSYDINEGIDFNEVLSISEKKISQERTFLEIQSVILGIDGVSRIEELEITDNNSTRTRNIRFSLITSNGETLEGEVNI